VRMLLEDLDNLHKGENKRGAQRCYEILDRRNIRHISFADWKKIDGAEIARGEPAGKPREKYTYISEMLALLD